MQYEQLVTTHIRLRIQQQVFYYSGVLILLFSTYISVSFGLLSPLDDIAPCNNSRVQIVNSTWGVISDGSANYSQDSQCEWLIQAPAATSLITLLVHSLRTECSYDYLFIFDGKSYRNATLLASLSGGTKPGQPFHASSGYMLILLYSDTNYVLEGFVAEFFATNCPLKCTDVSSCTGETKCDCEEDFGSISANNETVTKCSTQHSNKDHPATVQYYNQTSIGRVDHSALLIHHSLFVFGGYDLNSILSDMLVLNLKKGTIESIGQDSSDSGSWPGSRRGHASATYKNGFFIHGGKTASGIVNELYYYDTDKLQWMQFISNGLPSLVYHTMTRASNGYIYVHGGGMVTGQFSSRLYRFHGEDPSSWELLQSTCCGKEKGRRLLAHTMNYWPKENALVIFSGLVADVGKFAKLSSVVWIYWIDTSSWMPIEYWRLSGGFYQNIERAFHSAEIIGSHLMVIGGYTHTHNRDESCYASQVLIYNLKCHSLVPLPEIPSEKGLDVEGVFGQKTVFWSERNELLITGGYRGYLKTRIDRIPITFSVNSTECGSYKKRWECSGDAVCGWCPNDGKCYDKILGSKNCTTNLQTSQCPGICPLLRSCQRCVTVPACGWCESSDFCLERNRNDALNAISPQICPDKSLRSNLSYCVSDSERHRGVTLFEYKFPANWSQPDSVQILNSTMFSISRGETLNPNDPPAILSLKGFLVDATSPLEKLELCVYYAQANLTMAQGPTTNRENLALSIEWSRTNSSCANLTTWSSGLPVSLLPGAKISIDLNASMNEVFLLEKLGRVSLKHNLKLFRKEHLLPYSSQGGGCEEAQSCMKCTGDSSCLWDDKAHRCNSRMEWLRSEENTKLTKEVILLPEDCSTCNEFVTCSECARFGDCEWLEADAICIRKGRSGGRTEVIQEPENCLTECHLRTSCSSCLGFGVGGSCVWCSSTKECFAFSVYTSYYQFGGCLGWKDKESQCNKCNQTTCDDCLGQGMGCGWNYKEGGEGNCVEGDFGGSYDQNESNNDVGTLWTYTYDVCPDLDECTLELHECHPNALCINTPGSYLCKCKQGYAGDGKASCNETCFFQCVYGTCSGSPSFNCECELGWTGVDCSIDCGCNFWSKCESEGVGTCDLCEESTTGSNCEQCVSGSYGNATLAHIGCRPCECSSGNGDPARGFCDRVTGDCFCLNFTTGKNCNECEPGFFGSPELGGPCYRECRGRAVMTTPLGYFGLEGKIDSRTLAEHCLWIIQTQPEDGSLEEHELRITISNDYHIPCSENVLRVHSGLPSFATSRNPQLVASICSYAGDRAYLPIRITVRGLSASILLQHPRGGHYRAKFNASYELFRVSPGTSDPPEMRNNLPLVSAELSDGTSVLSRFGHTLFVDDRNVWIFGGFSFSHGVLNDVRQFRRDVGQWIPLTITVVQNEDSVPLGRYFHAGVLGPDSEIFIHGGITHNMNFLNDTWRFDTRLSHWKRLSKDSSKQIRLGGHTLTLRLRPDSAEGGSECQLVIIGGMNPWNGFSDKVYVSSCFAGGNWEEVNTTGSSPIGIYAHSTVYHRLSDTFYVYGGIVYEKDEVSSSSTLFSLHWPTKRWTLLPANQDNQLQKLPTPRFFHSAVTTDSYMVILGGSGSPKKSSLMVYSYDCNLWIGLGGDQIVDRSGGGASIANDELMLMGGWDGAVAPSQLLRVVLPEDVCSVQRSEENCKGTLGCSFCSSKKNETRASRCYSSGLDMPSECSTGASKRVPVEFWRGLTCSNQLVLGSNNCTNLYTCSDCLSVHLNFNVTQACHWCTTCLIGKCLPIEKKCSEEHSCGQKPRETQEASHCPERQCSASECEKCTATGKCIWTRQILRSSEWSFQLHSQPVYDWNCVRKTILDTKPSFSVSSSPPETCPDPCISHQTCSTCLESKGGSEGGYQECHWSMALNRCISPGHKWLFCFGGVCGSILRGQSSNCPKPCSVFNSCSSCLEAPDCGWCSVEGKNGEGECMTGNSIRSESNSGVCPNFNYNFLTCPLENECLNNHHKCDLESENCIDLDQGFRCECREGYRKLRDVCLPICTEGCLHGDCVSPNKCSCHFGYVGSNCSSSCNCNSHSNCASETELDTCLLCHNNTMGPQCSRCKPLFVGDPKNGGSCIACSDYCNSHSEICLSWESHLKFCGNGTGLTSAELKEIISLDESEPGPLNSAYCCSCNPESKTGGERCDICHAGYFRGTEDKRHPCRKCECNGHGNICNPISGTECNCNNNTESEICTPLVSKQSLNQQCWKVQCAKCREYYLGTPTNGHPCYRQMHVEQTYCFEPNSHEYCLIKPSPLKAGRTTFFAVQPKFMNVDIRINVDVTHGAVHMYLSPKEDTFVIRNDPNTFVHVVEFDTKYGLNGDRSDTYFDLNGTENGISLKSLQIEPFQLAEYEAAGFVTYVTVSEPKSVLVVRNIRNRLVVTLPQEDHDLRLTRFYMVLEGIGDGSVGSVFFRQDQLHIDLFVFFSVFFSAFFLFLAACGIAWKFKQNMEARQARHRHAAQMLSMAKRPFSTWTLIVEPDISSPLYSVYSQCRKSCRKGCVCLRPVAIEMAQDGVSAICTMFVSLPGGSMAPCRLGLASSLATHAQSQTTHVINLRRRRN